MSLALVYLAVGLAVLLFGAEFLVRGASRLAISFGIEPAVVGLTVVAMGTSAPELAVSVMAALSGHTEIAFGNVVGSNICNLGLVLGLCAMIVPLVIEKSVMVFLPVMFASAAAIPLMAWDGQIGPIDGGILLSAGAAYIYWVVRRHRAAAGRPRDKKPDGESHKPEPLAATARNGALIAAGIVLLVGGSYGIVTGAKTIAELLGIPERVIGLSLIALNTSLPELATSLVAIARKHTAIGVGNLVGSNIANVLLVLGVTSLVSTVPASLDLARSVDILVMLAVSLLLIFLARSSHRVNRMGGGVLLTVYLGYMVSLFVVTL